MKLYTTPEQTEKLIGLGFVPKMEIKGVQVVHSKVEVDHDCYFAIGELISFLPDDGVSDRRLEFDGFHWIVDWDSFDKIHQTMQVELVDALYDMVVKLKEEGVI